MFILTPSRNRAAFMAVSSKGTHLHQIRADCEHRQPKPWDKEQGKSCRRGLCRKILQDNYNLLIHSRP